LSQFQVASAAMFTSLLSTNNEFKVSDDSGEFLFNRVTPTTGPTAGSVTTLDVGDVIITGFNIHTLESSAGPTSSIGGGGPNDSVNGISAIEVAGFLTDSGGNTIGIFFTPLDAAALTDIALRPDLVATSAILATWKHDGSGNLQSMIGLYDAGSNSADFQRNGGADDGDLSHTGADIGTGLFASEDAAIATAAIGSKLAEFGFIGAAGEFWLAQPANSGTSFALFADVAVAASQSSGSNFGVVNFGLNQTSADQFSVFKIETTAFSPGNTFGLVGNANFQGTQKGTASPVNTSFDIQDDLNAQFAVSGVLPEPTSLVILGVGLFGLVAGAAGRSRWRI